jgi:GT2 family glycosyltransferase
MADVSVHIVTYNSESLIRDCLQSVIAQSHPVKEIIVVDNESRDGTLDVLADFTDKITLIPNSINNGFAGGHNQALSQSTSEYHLILNPDIVLDPDYLLYIIRYMDAHEDAGACTGKLLRTAEPDRLDSAGLVIHRNRRAFDRGASLPESDYNEITEIFGVSGAAAVYSRAMVKDVSVNGQFFDELFFAYKEDVDVSWRSQIYGWKSVYIPQAIAYHERGWKQGKRNAQPLVIRQHSYINRYLMMIKNDQLSAICKNILPLLTFEFASLLYYLLREPKVLLAWSSVVRNRRSLLRDRKLIQSKRKVPLAEIYNYFE